jgi:hypothetical protein
MKKTTSAIISFILMFVFCITPTAYSAEKAPSVDEMVTILNQYATPYYGSQPNEDYDFNHDGVLDCFDMIRLRKMLINGEGNVTVASAVKLQGWLLGNPNYTLTITRFPSTYFSMPTDLANDTFKNLTSSDFKFINAKKEVLIDPVDPTDITKGIELTFLNDGETITESVFFTKFVNTIDEFDELVAATSNPGFYIGIKNKNYALCEKTEYTNPSDFYNTITSNVSKPTPGEISEKEVDKTVNSAFCMYDLTKPSKDPSDLAIIIEATLYSAPYTFTTTKLEDGTITISAKNEESELHLIVEEKKMKPVSQIIFDNSAFTLFIINNEDFGVIIK